MEKSRQQVRPSTFFLLTYLLSWLIWIPLDLAHFGIGGLSIPEGASNTVRLLGVLMPAVAALILTGLRSGREGLRGLLKRLTIWRVGWKWWAAATMIQPVLLILAALVYNLLLGQPPVTPIPIDSVSAFIITVIFLLIAALGEEIGWRGVALPSLQVRNSALVSSIILGLLWGAWHIPFWLLMDTFDQFGGLYLVLNFLLLPLTFFITWIFNHTHSSLLMPVVLHLAFNIVNTILLPVTLNVTAFGLFIALNWLAMIPILSRLGHDTRFEGNVVS
jgi:membrane protease YdiL (CAAX protease family)